MFGLDWIQYLSSYYLALSVTDKWGWALARMRWPIYNLSYFSASQPDIDALIPHKYVRKSAINNNLAIPTSNPFCYGLPYTLLKVFTWEMLTKVQKNNPSSSYHTCHEQHRPKDRVEYSLFIASPEQPLHSGSCNKCQNTTQVKVKSNWFKKYLSVKSKKYYTLHINAWIGLQHINVQWIVNHKITDS